MTPPRPAPDVRTPSQLRRELVGLHVWAGSPGARRLSTAAAEANLTLARSTTQDLISGARVGGLPSRDFVRAFVTACLTHAGAEDPESTVESWDQAWLAVVQSHGHIPTTPTSRQPAKNNSRHRVIFAAVAATVALAATAVITFLVTTPDDPPEPVAATTEIQDIYCAEDGLTANWRNHHSQLYLAADNAKPAAEVLAAPSPETTFSVTRHKIPEIDGCTHELAVGTVCLEASGASEVIEAECTNRREQLWVLENHWHHEGVMWQRLHPAHRTDLCLQQRTDEESTNPQAVLKPCGTNWIQQWHLQPSAK